jgi:hypothetical protein
MPGKIRTNFNRDTLGFTSFANPLDCEEFKIKNYNLLQINWWIYYPIGANGGLKPRMSPPVGGWKTF